ncbi:FxLYD domain-containing protein [Alkalihalobacillus sp. BA299]|uniref:FxLYD domain-containing protein n=1 Tax=Alkalihalobacillus sp. BA299 TaxID=2815938 RepID=UPI001ADAA553|nr:FxLYD domain-containing protein [Alkalihalobacillus sp. BA299]
MFCHSCGNKRLNNETYCSKCGTAFINNLEEISATIEQNSFSSTLPPINQQSNNKKTLYLWLLPLVSSLFVTIGLISYYYYETKINERVVSLNQQIEASLSSGDYEQSQQQLTEALQLRDVDTLQQFEDIIAAALIYEQELQEINELIQRNEVDQASHQIETLNEQINETTYPSLLQPIQKKLEKAAITLTVVEVKMELNELTTVEELAHKLSSLSSLNNEETEKIKQQIVNKIVQFSYEKAEKHLQQHEFSNALYALETGLQYAINNEKLLSFIERVKNEKLAFEKAEQTRLEEAMIAAAKEDLKNRTEAVEITSLDIELDKYGDIYLYGDVINNGTTTIYSIDIHYSIFDKNDEFVGNSVTSVYPYYLSPGETGRFSHSYYGVYEELNVTVDSITWQIE